MFIYAPLVKCEGAMTYHNWRENKVKYKNPLIAYSHRISKNNPSWISFGFKTVKAIPIYKTGPKN